MSIAAKILVHRMGINQKQLSAHNSNKENVRLTAKECGTQLFFTHINDDVDIPLILEKKCDYRVESFQ